MHWLDIVILVTLGVGAAMGFCSGLLWQVARVVSLAVSLYVAILSNAGVADWLGQQWTDTSPAVNRVIAFLGVFILVYLSLYILTRFIHKAITESKLELVDRLLGAIAGAVKMAAVAACLCAVMAALDLQIFREWFAQATIARNFARGTEIAVSWVPPAYRERLDDGVTQVREQLQKKVTDAALNTLKQ